MPFYCLPDFKDEDFLPLSSPIHVPYCVVVERKLVFFKYKAVNYSKACPSEPISPNTVCCVQSINIFPSILFGIGTVCPGKHIVSTNVSSYKPVCPRKCLFKKICSAK